MKQLVVPPPLSIMHSDDGEEAACIGLDVNAGCWHKAPAAYT